MIVFESQPGLESLVYVAVEFKQIKLCRCILVHMIHDCSEFWASFFLNTPEKHLMSTIFIHYFNNKSFFL